MVIINIAGERVGVKEMMMLSDENDLRRVNDKLVEENVELRRQFVIAEDLVLEVNQVAKDRE